MMKHRWSFSTYFLMLLSVFSAGIVWAEGAGLLQDRYAVFMDPEGAGLETTVHDVKGTDGLCNGSATELCLHNGRFSVRVDWADFEGNMGEGAVVPFGSDDSGLLWFFDADNWEMLIKVLDGCSVNDHFWVFSAATTNVEYTLQVTDHSAGVVKEYFNPLANAPPAITDVGAFATCDVPGPTDVPPGPPGLLIFANPTSIAVERDSLITIIARDSEGFPFRSGRRIRLVSDLGTVTEEVFTNSRGEAEAVFTAGSLPGTGSVTAIGDNSDPVTVMLNIRDAAGSVVLQVQPEVIPRGTDAEVQLTAIVLNPRGQPLSGQLVTFSSEVGELVPGSQVFSNVFGEAQTTLTVSGSQTVPDSFNVFATVFSEGEVLTVSVEILVL